jgi:hypothetical protein
MATHGTVDQLMGRPYYRTLWTFFQVQEVERIDALRERGRQLHVAGLLALAFHEPKRLAEEHHTLMHDAGMLPTEDEALEGVVDVIEAMRRIDAGELKTTVAGEAATATQGT